VHQYEVPVDLAVGLEVVVAHVDRTAVEIHHSALDLHSVDGPAGATQRRREGHRLVDQPALRVAKAHGEQALVLDEPVEVAQDLNARAFAHQIGQGLLDGPGDERGADVEVAHEPLQREAVDQRNDRIRDRGQCDREGKNESE
jgi:hypothetical protein